MVGTGHWDELENQASQDVEHTVPNLCAFCLINAVVFLFGRLGPSLPIISEIPRGGFNSDDSDDDAASKAPFMTTQLSTSVALP